MTWKRTLIPILLFTSSNAYAGEVTPPPDEEAPAQLLELRGSMAEAGEKAALESKTHYRPLCDADGYPLVGNLLPKEPDDSMPQVLATQEPPYQPSEFCAEIRTDESKT
jgi:hypothetical protein